MALPIVGGSDGAWGTTLNNFLGGAAGDGTPTIPNNRIPYLSGGNHTSSANLTFDGTRLTTTRLTINADDAAQVALIVNTAASATAFAQRWDFNGTAGADVRLTASFANIHISERDLGNDVRGASFEAARNSNGGTEGPAAGHLILSEADGAANGVLWSDITGVLRINTTAPTGSTGTPTVGDTAGTVVGTQTSWWELKENISPFVAYSKALAAVVAAPLFSFDMNGRHYDAGYVIYEEDKGKWFSWNDGRQQIPALNERQLFGYLAASIKALNARIEKLEGRAQ